MLSFARLFLISINQLTVAVVAFAAQSAVASTSPVGVNLQQFSSYAPEWTVVDAFAKTRKWTAGAQLPGKSRSIWNVCSKENPVYDHTLCETQPPMTLDERGWVADAAKDIQPHTTVFEELGSDFPSGRYILLFEGDGEIRIQGSLNRKSRGNCSRRTFNNGRGCIDIDSEKGRGIGLWIDSFSRENPVRNIRLIVPGGVHGVVSNDGTIESVDHTRLCSPEQER